MARKKRSADVDNGITDVDNGIDTWPNGSDLSQLPIVDGTESPITGEEDKWGTLPDNARKFVLNSDEFTAVPLKKGIFQVIARNNVPGTDKNEQVIYIADNPNGDGALRVTKNFNIETTGRTALYLRGQSDIDVAIGNLSAELGKKANIDDVYNKAQTDQLIANAVGNVINIFTYKGLLPNETEIKNVADPKTGDCYQAEDTQDFWVYIEENGTGEWQKLSGSLIDLSDYYNKGEVDIKLAEKASESDLEALTEVVNMLANRVRPFTYIQIDDPSTPEGAPPTDKTKEGETWFNPATGTIKIRKLAADGSLFWYDSSENLKIELAGKYITIDTQQTVTGLKNFNTLPTSDMTPVNANQLVTKSYVDNALNGNQGGQVGNFVTLDTEQTVVATKIFNSIKTTKTPTDNNDVATKLYVDEVKQNIETQLPAIDDLVTLNTEQTIEGRKIFENIQVVNAAISDNDVPNFKQIKDGFVDLYEDQVVQGLKTFEDIKATKEPVDDEDVVNLKYFNENKGSGGGSLTYPEHTAILKNSIITIELGRNGLISYNAQKIQDLVLVDLVGNEYRLLKADNTAITAYPEKSGVAILTTKDYMNDVKETLDFNSTIEYLNNDYVLKDNEIRVTVSYDVLSIYDAAYSYMIMFKKAAKSPSNLSLGDYYMGKMNDIDNNRKIYITIEAVNSNFVDIAKVKFNTPGAEKVTISVNNKYTVEKNLAADDILEYAPQDDSVGSFLYSNISQLVEASHVLEKNIHSLVPAISDTNLVRKKEFDAYNNNLVEAMFSPSESYIKAGFTMKVSFEGLAPYRTGLCCGLCLKNNINGLIYKAYRITYTAFNTIYPGEIICILTSNSNKPLKYDEDNYALEAYQVEEDEIKLKLSFAKVSQYAAKWGYGAMFDFWPNVKSVCYDYYMGANLDVNTTFNITIVDIGSKAAFTAIQIGEPESAAQQTMILNINNNEREIRFLVSTGKSVLTRSGNYDGRVIEINELKTQPLKVITKQDIPSYLKIPSTSFTLEGNTTDPDNLGANLFKLNSPLNIIFINILNSQTFVVDNEYHPIFNDKGSLLGIATNRNNLDNAIIFGYNYKE
ncbi:TPA: hypothetical protein RTG63_001714 [Campylobacter jejuni]|nr:hypothetical protein [Campylobacter jejuni]